VEGQADIAVGEEPARTASGYRGYAVEAVDRVRFVKTAQQAGLSLRQIGEIIAVREQGEAPCAHVAALVDARLRDIEQRLVELRSLRRQLRELRERVKTLDAATSASEDVCSAVHRRR
jgi:MerR family copper efflux transcriptional regulator